MHTVFILESDVWILLKVWEIKYTVIERVCFRFLLCSALFPVNNKL